MGVQDRINRNDGTFPLAGSIKAALEKPFVVNQNAVSKMVDNSLFSSLNVKYASNKIMFTSQTAYLSNRRIYDAPIDGDFSPLDAVNIINNYENPWNKVTALAQEFRLNSTGSSLPQWMVGSFLFSSNEPTKQATHFGKDAGLLSIPDKIFPRFIQAETEEMGRHCLDKLPTVSLRNYTSLQVLGLTMKPSAIR